MGLQGWIALVTGRANGTGKAICLKLPRDGKQTYLDNSLKTKTIEHYKQECF
jgi:NAD(P)-dependent dehydrogenase (short-subunit alcohol dehydrogenase family)